MFRTQSCRYGREHQVSAAPCQTDRSSLGSLRVVTGDPPGSRVESVLEPTRSYTCFLREKGVGYPIAGEKNGKFGIM